jgi:homogentisate 1,2-dioxygenase
MDGTINQEVSIMVYGFMPPEYHRNLDMKEIMEWNALAYRRME